MVWVVGTRKKKSVRIRKGPKFCTMAVLESFIELSRDPAERAAYMRMIKFLKAGKISEFERAPGSIGIINGEAVALVKLENFLDAQMTWLDVETKVKGKPAYRKKIRSAFTSLAKNLGYKGKWDMLSSHLVRKASRMYDW